MHVGYDAVSELSVCLLCGVNAYAHGAECVLFELPAGAVRLAHWSGDPDGCSATCTGPHHGDHLDPDAVCERCGGSALACFNGSAGQGCAFSGRGRDV